MRRFNIVIPKEDGGIEVHPMKEWLRQHPDNIPPGMDTRENTSHQLRDNLLKMGWRIQETDTEVRLIPPGISDSLVEIDTILGDSDDEAEEDVAPVFTLEHQLRDFLAENIHTVSINGKRLKLFVDQK